MYGELKTKSLDPNDNMNVIDFLKNNKSDFAVFDTFISEEMFSHYIHRLFPQSVKILDL